MCTVTWFQDDERYGLYCNRDELRSRPEARPPRVQDSKGTPFLAPEDGLAGGTWIAANARGLSLCLLNDYSSMQPDAPTDPTSRGLLVRDLIRASGSGELESRWSSLELRSYRPFKILALEPSQAPFLLSWDGRVSRLDQEGVAPPLCSSSFDERGATRARSDLLEEMATKEGLEIRKRLFRFHQSHRPERGPYSVCMHRPDAVTVSFTVVDVDSDCVSMAYAHGAPCSAPLEHLVTLRRQG